MIRQILVMSSLQLEKREWIKLFMFDMRATIIEGYHEVSFQGKLNKVHMTFVFKWGECLFYYGTHKSFV